MAIMITFGLNTMVMTEGAMVMMILMTPIATMAIMIGIMILVL